MSAGDTGEYPLVARCVAAMDGDDALSQAQTMGQDIYSYDPKSRGAEHYRAMAALLLERMA